MRVLLDAHAFLWFVLGDSRLKSAARTCIVDAANEKLISPASYWELAIKISLGKYTLSQPLQAFMEKGIDDNGFIILPIGIKHAAELITLPFHHRDPFDRLIIAQAIVEQSPVVSTDSAFDAYPTRIW